MSFARAFSIIAALALSVAVPSLMAHGEAHGDKVKTKSVATVKEQKPWGIAGDAKSVLRTIEVRMTDDMRFSPDRIQVKQGETVRFVMRNMGKMLHEMVIGTQQDLDQHAAMMLKFPDMEHDEPYMTHVKPGQRGQIVWNFNRPGEFQFACLVAGHYQAGMVGTIGVANPEELTHRK